AAAYNAPHTAAEKILAEIWSEILDIEQQIGIDDDFFALGGHSLLVVSFCVHIEDRLRKSISFSQVFQFPTIRQLAALITGETSQVRDLLEEPDIKQGRTEEKFFWMGDGFALLQQHLSSDKSLHRFPNLGEDGRRPEFRSVEELAAHYRKAITTIQPHGSYSLGGFSFGGLVMYEVAQQIKKHTEDAVLLFLLEPTIFNLQNTARETRSSTPLVNPPQHSMHSKFLFHFDQFKTLNFKRKIAYSLEWLSGQINNRLIERYKRYKLNIQPFQNNLVCQLYLLSHRPIPSRLRNFYIINTNLKLAKRYTPQKYPGRVIIVESGQRSSVEFYSKISNLPIDEEIVIIIPECSNHTDLLNAPHYHTWMEQLRKYLPETARGSG
ncbi:MAG: phosphopantetheine-binding protein, partial [Anaerolineaceae bacterium]|nr:phosphopantetheine-binding protein [Anaerolineaceae bacterium]